MTAYEDEASSEDDEKLLEMDGGDGGPTMRISHCH